MKANAITRIVIWSIVIVLLAGILAVGLGNQAFTQNLVIQKDESRSTILHATVADETPIFSVPNESGSVVTILAPGDSLELSREENVMGSRWGCVTSPVSGWVPMDALLEVYRVPSEDSPPSGSASVPADQVQSISIDWVGGRVILCPYDVEEIEFYETGADSEKNAMRWKVKQGKLSIEYCEDTVFPFFGVNIDISKDLTIYVPRDWVCEDLELDAASATLEVCGLNIREVEVDTASGTCFFEDCNIDLLDVDSASGDIQYTGSLMELDCDAASACFRGTLTNVPRRVDMDSASGDLELTLPEGAGFTLTLDAMSSDFSSDFETVMKNGSYVHGDGYCRIDMDAMSGDVRIYKGA